MCRLFQTIAGHTLGPLNESLLLSCRKWVERSHLSQETIRWRLDTFQHGAWIHVDTLLTRVQRSWSSSPTLGSSWRVANWTIHVIWLRIRGTGVWLRRSHILKLST